MKPTLKKLYSKIEGESPECQKNIAASIEVSMKKVQRDLELDQPDALDTSSCCGPIVIYNYFCILVFFVFIYVLMYKNNGIYYDRSVWG